MNRILTQNIRSPFGASAVRGAHTLTPMALLTAVAGVVASWVERANQRRALADMDTRQLEDLGISRADALVEADKPFWA